MGYNKIWSILDVAKLFNHPIEFIPSRMGEAEFTGFENYGNNGLNWSAKINLEDYIKKFIENNPH